MAAIFIGVQSSNPGVRSELEKLAAEWPDRDFWHTPVLVGPDAWSSRPCGTRAADIIRHSPEHMRAALQRLSDER